MLLALMALTILIELQSFLGSIGYYRAYVMAYATRAYPLNGLLKKDVVWEWTDDCEIAFKDLKEALATSLILKPPFYDKEFFCLHQRHRDLHKLLFSPYMG